MNGHTNQALAACIAVSTWLLTSVTEDPVVWGSWGAFMVVLVIAVMYFDKPEKKKGDE